MSGDLVAERSIEVQGYRLVVPSPATSLVSVPDRLLRLIETEATGRTLLIGLDGIGFDVAGRHLSAGSLTPLRSVFPSTSVAAWLSLISGEEPDRHGVLGTVSWAPSTAQVVSYLGDHRFDWTGPVPLAEGAPRPLPATDSTIFSALRRRGIRPVVELTSMSGWSSGWVRAMTAGADVRPAAPDAWMALEDEPVRLVREAMAVGRSAVLESDAPTFAFVYLNLDDHLHVHGVDGTISCALCVLNDEAEALAGQGVTVIAVSDHGQCASKAPNDMTRAWRELAGPRWCRRPAGGAGRVRWLYPHPASVDVVHSRLAAALGDEVLVTSPTELAEMGLWGDVAAVHDTVGEVVAVALGEHFPAPVPGYAWEHGSATEAEMVVPLAVWSGRDA
jgi:hypothetical protein